MKRVRQKSTNAELELRRALHAKGLRYRLHLPLIKRPRRVADIIFPRQRVAVFVDGCFWHGCPEHGTWPKKNADFWRNKIIANRERDADTNKRLEALGWKVVRIWSHHAPMEAASMIARIIEERKSEKNQ
ncbi:MAG: very short patch repair endonuclease [Saprospirales bacterium]|nr:very short patch repair endonuclease [Saprospirales bacterium]